MPIFLKKKKLLTNKIYMRISYYITILIKVRIIWFVYKDLNYTQWNFYNNYNYIIIFLLQFDFLKNIYTVAVIKTWWIYSNIN